MSVTLTALSNPFEGNLAATADRLARDSFRRALRSIDDRAKREGCAPPGIDVDASSASSPLVTCWTPELGAVGCGLRADRARPCWEWLSAQTKVAAILLGLIDVVEVAFAGEHPLAIAGHFIRGARLCVQGDAQRLTVRDGDGSVLLALARSRRDEGARVWVASEDDVL